MAAIFPQLRRARYLLFGVAAVLCLTIGLHESAHAQAAPPAAATSGANRGSSSPGSPRSERIRAELARILAEPEFQPARVSDSAFSRFTQWLSNIWEKVKEFFGRLFTFGGRAGAGAGNMIFWIVLVVAIVALAYAIAFVIQRFGMPLKRGGRRAGSTLALEPEEDASTEPDDLLAAARRYAASGDLRRAYRAAFVATLLRLDRQGVIRFDRARTNGEYLRLLRAHPPLHATVQPIARDFDLRWYGGAPISEPDFQRVLAAYQTVAALHPKPASQA